MSQSSTSWNGDIGTRYERLATEFAKLRASATVLKKGVLEERAKSDKLTEELKLAENVTRKLRSENESLTFRNEQLLKRVQNVQDELEESHRSQGGKKKQKRKEEGVSEREKQLETSLAILEEELKNKLSHNEKLTNKIEEISQLNEMLTLQLRELKDRIEEMDKEGRGLKSRIPERQIITENGTYSSSPSPSLISQSSTAVLLTDSPLWQIAESGRTLLTGMSTLLSLLEQRVRIFPYDATLEKLPPHVEQLGCYLGEASKKFAFSYEVSNRLFEEPAEKWRESASSILSSMEEAISHCVQNLPSLLIRLSEEESRCAWSDSALEALNERWRVSLCALFSSLSTFHSSISLSIEGNNEELTALSKTVNALHLAIKSTQECFSARWLVETRLPVQTKKGKCVGTATRDCLLKILGTSQKIFARMNTLSMEMEAKMKEAVKESIKENMIAKDENVDVDMLRSEEELTVPKAVETPVESSKIGRKESILSSKSVQIVNSTRVEKELPWRETELHILRSRVDELEGEREKMLLDIALMRRKIANGSNQTDDSSISREAERHYRSRLREMSSKVIQATSRGNYFNSECENLVRSFRCMEDERKKLEDQIDFITKEKLSLFDELRVTQYGYESKLREMSDHVASLNSEKEERDKEKERNSKNTLSRRLTLFK